MKPFNLGTTLSLLIVATSCLPFQACTNCPVHDSDPVSYSSGHRNSEKTLYESNAVNEAWLPFSSGTTYDFPHGLVDRPFAVYTYVSFDEHPVDGKSSDANHPDHVSESAGNQAVIERWDDKTIRVRNDSCATFYLRVVAVADPSTSAAGGAGGATF